MLKKVEAQLQKVHGEWLEQWKTQPEGLNYLDKMASASNCLVARETKQRLQAILTESHASLYWGAVESEFDRLIAIEQEAKAHAKKTGETSQTLGASRVQVTTPSSAAPTAQPAPSAPTDGVPCEGGDAEGCDFVEVSTKEDNSVHSSPEKVADA